MKRSRSQGTNHGPPNYRSTALEDSIEMLHQIFQAVDLFSRKTLREFGVTGPQIWALQTIEDSRVLSMGELAHQMHLHISTVTGIIDRLESGKLVVRERSSGDARVVELRLTNKGRLILSKAPEPPRSKVARGLRMLSTQKLKRVQQALHLIAQAMEIPL